MNTRFSNELMKLIPGFCGTFPCDLLPSPKPYSSFVVNTDTSDYGGEHWIAIYIAQSNWYFFDSFGRTIDQFPDSFKKYMKKASKNFNVRTSSQPLQSYKSDSCGYWCAYFLYCKTMNYTFMFKDFSNDRKRNEAVLYHFMEYQLKLLPEFMNRFKLTKRQMKMLLEIRLAL